MSLTRVGAVACVTIHRPEVRNALDHESWSRMREYLAAVAEDDGVRAVVLSGGDAFFSAGGDVGTMQGQGDTLLGPVKRLDLAQAVIRAVTSMDKLVVAAVEGYAIGVAWGLVLSCDLVVAGASAFFQGPFALRGLVADGAVAWHLPRHLGRQRATRVLLLGERLAAEDAFEAGLVSHIAADGEANSTAHELASSLAAGPRESNGLTKSLVVRGQDVDLHTYLEMERVAVALGARGADAAEGRAAFAEKRAATYP